MRRAEIEEQALFFMCRSRDALIEVLGHGVTGSGQHHEIRAREHLMISSSGGARPRRVGIFVGVRLTRRRACPAPTLVRQIGAEVPSADDASGLPDAAPA